jgi:hypothetical protein
VRVEFLAPTDKLPHVSGVHGLQEISHWP